MFKKVLLGIFIFTFLFLVKSVTAQTNECTDRYLTLINPVRSRALWTDKSLNPIQSQYSLIKNKNFSATWLVQDDVLSDVGLTSEIKKFNSSQEIGILLEISENLARNARVIYPSFTTWYNPKAVFLSGYTQSERRLLLDKMFNDFYQNFGYFPKSVGAWWIDSYSLNYLKEKYGITSALIVADQKNTDNYGVWGQWWSVPYYPSKANILTPASSLSDKQPVVIMQWAQRDPVLAYGKDYFSSYSLQANDYTLLGKDTNYFESLVQVYLDCQNRIGQITIGLETGMESIWALPEYSRQLEYLKSLSLLKSVTMSQFAKNYSQIYPEFQKKSEIKYQDSVVSMTTEGRTNKKFNENIKYVPNLAFQDYFLPDQNNFLERILPTNGAFDDGSKYSYLYVLAFIFWFAYLGLKRKFKILLISFFFVLASFGLILRSDTQFGWFVFYGPVFNNSPIFKFLIVFSGFGFIFLINKYIKNTKFLYLVPLIFGADTILQVIRFSFISDKYYLGILSDAFHFLGLSFEKPFSFALVSQDFPSYQALALLHFDYNLIWKNIWISTIIFPLVHVLLAYILWHILQIFPEKLKRILIIILILLFLIYLNNIWQADPQAAIISATIN